MRQKQPCRRRMSCFVAVMRPRHRADQRWPEPLLTSLMPAAVLSRTQRTFPLISAAMLAHHLSLARDFLLVVRCQPRLVSSDLQIKPPAFQRRLILHSRRPAYSATLLNFTHVKSFLARDSMFRSRRYVSADRSWHCNNEAGNLHVRIRYRPVLVFAVFYDISHRYNCVPAPSF